LRGNNSQWRKEKEEEEEITTANRRALSETAETALRGSEASIAALET